MSSVEPVVVDTEVDCASVEVPLRENVKQRRKRKSRRISESDSTASGGSSGSQKASLTHSVPAKLNTDIMYLMKMETAPRKPRKRAKYRSGFSPSCGASEDHKKAYKANSCDMRPETTDKQPRSWNTTLSPRSLHPVPSLSPKSSSKPRKLGSGIIQRVRRFTDSGDDRKSFTLSRDDSAGQFGSDTAELSSFLKSHSTSELGKRELVVNEIITTEKQYLADLALLINDFLEPMRNMNIPKESLQKIFGNIEVIHNINSDVLADLETRLENKPDHDILVGDVFLNLVSIRWVA